MNRSLLSIAALLLAACQPSPGPGPQPPPQPDADSAAPAPAPLIDASAPAEASTAPVDAGADASTWPDTPCGRACAALERFGCREARPTPRGIPCDRVCEDVLAFPELSLPTACIAKATSKAAMQKCGVCR